MPRDQEAALIGARHAMRRCPDDKHLCNGRSGYIQPLLIRPLRCNATLMDDGFLFSRAVAAMPAYPCNTIGFLTRHLASSDVIYHTFISTKSVQRVTCVRL